MMKDSAFVVVILALVLGTTAQTPSPKAVPAPTKAPQPWAPIPMPTLPPEYQLQSERVAVTNLLGAIFAPYCGSDTFSSFQFNNTQASPAYPVIVMCVHSQLRVDAPGKVTKLP